MSTKEQMLAAVMALGAGATASAAPVTVNQTLSLGDLLNGNSTALTFDLSATLASKGLSASQVLGGTLVVYGVSDASYGSAQAQSYGAYSQIGNTVTNNYSVYLGNGSSCYYYSSWSGGSSCYYYPVYGGATDNLRDMGAERDVVFNDSIADAMLVQTGTSQAEAQAGAAAAATGNYSGWALVNTTYSGNGTYGRDTTRYFNRERNIYQGYFGGMEANLALDGAALADFALDGLLSASVTSTLGRVQLQSAWLQLQIDDTPVRSNSLPLPGTLSLASLGALAAYGARRRRPS